MELVQRAQAIRAKTQRERDYIDALAFFYRDYDKVDYQNRIGAYSRAMDEMYQQYPNDLQAAVFYALSLLTWQVELVNAADNHPAMFTFAIGTWLSPSEFPNVRSNFALRLYDASLLH